MPSRGVPGLTVVLALGNLVFGFPVLSVLLLNYSRNAASAAPNPHYTALRDPLAWLFILVLLIACGAVAWGIGRLGRK